MQQSSERERASEASLDVERSETSGGTWGSSPSGGLRWGRAGGMRQRSPSTVVRVTGSDFVIVRPGAISENALRAALEKR
jgi:hypothetical protein